MDLILVSKRSPNLTVVPTEATRCRLSSTQQRKSLHGEDGTRSDTTVKTTEVLMFRCGCVYRRQVYQQLRSVYPTLACRQFLDGLQQLEEECGYGEDQIPQLRDVSAFLKGDKTLRLRGERTLWLMLFWQLQKQEICD